MSPLVHTLLTLVTIAETISASPLHSRTAYAIKDSHNVPRQWSKVSSASSDHILHLQIALKQNNFDELERHLYEGMINA